MNVAPAEFANSLTHGLACAALSPGLRSVLIFDLPPAELRSWASVMAQMIEAATGERSLQVILSSSEAEEVLWGGFAPRTQPEGAPLGWQPGLLANAADDDVRRLVLIPDLSRLSLVSARALVMLIGTEVAHLERQGRQQRWLPRMIWLAACPSAAAGRISLHLLDRFALRLRARSKMPAKRTDELLARLRVPESAEVTPLAQISDHLQQHLHAAYQRWPTLTDSALVCVAEYQLSAAQGSLRRELALTRLAHAMARLAGDPEMLAAHVDDAARLIGLQKPVAKPTSSETVPPQGLQTPTGAGTPTPAESPATPPAPPRGVDGPVKEPIVDTPEEAVNVSPPAALPAATLTAPLDPYQEDRQTTEREAASLRLPFQHARRASAARGVVIGSESARDLRDLALVSTLLEAAKFQPIRRQQREQPGDDLDHRIGHFWPPNRAGRVVKHLILLVVRRFAQLVSTWGGRRHDQGPGDPLLISPTDLRSYRRAPAPEQMLMLLLDYTCLRRCRWLEVLLPYFKWAYIERASLCLIQVGAATAHHPLRAERLLFSSVLVPGLSTALEAGPGRATPLAHGLELARQTLQHALQHGRQTTQRALLAVISDGRGNVPLAASISGELTYPVSREGITDALQTAQRLRSLDRLEILFLNPQPRTYTALPTELAGALGVEAQDIPLCDESEV